MNEKKTLKLGVIGMPISHSLSPEIHRQFATQFEHSIAYERYPVQPEALESFVHDFFQSQGVGLNVTLPHKSAVKTWVDHLTPESQLTGSVNTVFRSDNDKLVGHTTDGDGLLLAMKKSNLPVTGRNILVLGAGGAAASIVYSLLQAKANIILFNRTEAKAEGLVEQYSPFGQIQKYSNQSNFDGVINTISEFDESFYRPFAESIRNADYCYDLNYGERAAAFNQYCQQLGQARVVAGLDMLIGQAAYSYQKWTGELPDIRSIKVG